MSNIFLNVTVSLRYCAAVLFFVLDKNKKISKTTAFMDLILFSNANDVMFISFRMTPPSQWPIYCVQMSCACERMNKKPFFLFMVPQPKKRMLRIPPSSLSLNSGLWQSKFRNNDDRCFMVSIKRCPFPIGSPPSRGGLSPWLMATAVVELLCPRWAGLEFGLVPFLKML